ncbi:MAG: T9SS type A sorting domain-containing protein [Chitinophagales bacterium]
MKIFYTVIFTAFLSTYAFTQSTFNRVYTILQANCTGACHTSSVYSGSLDLTGTEQAVYNALYNVTPSNTAAAAKGLKLVDPGDPRNSFLFKKVNHGLDANLSLDINEGVAMPNGLTSLTETEREMIRQWILFEAKDTGILVNEQTIIDFYVGQGGQPRIQTLAPPAANEGVQLYWGPLFLTSGREVEYSNKFKVRNPVTADVTRMNVTENEESHHFAVYKFYEGHDTLFTSGMHKVNGIGDEAALFYHADVIAQWPNDIDLHYPAGTGYLFDSNSVVSITYHLINYNDSIIAAEAYMNIYYQPHQASVIPIKTAQIRYGGDQVGDLIIPDFGHDTTFTINQFEPDSAFYWNIISMQAHTHKLGKEYNVWLRNANGTKDTLIYDGHYDASYTFNQGVYIWDNPPYRQFSPPLQVDLRKGLIHEATFRNNGPGWVGFGLTTNDEMYVTFIVYYKSEFPSGVSEDTYTDSYLKFYPNPVNNVAYIELKETINLQNVTLQLYDLLGNKAGSSYDISGGVMKVRMENLPNGCYIYKLQNNGEVTATGKVILQR